MVWFKEEDTMAKKNVGFTQQTQKKTLLAIYHQM